MTSDSEAEGGMPTSAAGSPATLPPHADPTPASAAANTWPARELERARAVANGTAEWLLD
jgi:hypothetical protein